MQIYRNLVPVLSLLVAVILAVLPWGLSDAGRLALALLPGSIIFYWVMSSPGMLSVFSVFISGLVLDVLGGGYLGHWAIVYLVAFGASVLLLRFDFIVLGIGGFLYPGVVVAMLGVSYLLGSIMAGVLPASTFLSAGVMAIVCFPVIYGLLWVMDRPSLMGQKDSQWTGSRVLP